MKMNYEPYLTVVNENLINYLNADDGLNSAVLNAMKYSVNAGGKRIRPVVLLSCCEIFCGCFNIAVPFACAIEMIHTYSLIHDDLPALDNDDFRRGILSCHKKHGEWAAILAGDGLLSLAFSIMVNEIYAQPNHQYAIPMLKACKIICDAAGINGMISGQTGDILWENKSPPLETLTFINEKKTGALISAAFEAGAILGGADEINARTFAKAGEKIGLAFQIKDDILDLEGSFDKVGKLSGSDKKNNKTTYVDLLGLKACEKMVEDASIDAKSLINSTGKHSVFIDSLIDGLVIRDN